MKKVISKAPVENYTLTADADPKKKYLCWRKGSTTLEDGNLSVVSYLSVGQRTVYVPMAFGGVTKGHYYVAYKSESLSGLLELLLKDEWQIYEFESMIELCLWVAEMQNRKKRKR